MPNTGMDWWVIIGVLAGVAAAYFAWRQLRGKSAKTQNIVEHGSGNELSGGEGETSNTVKHGDNNKLNG